MAHPTAAAIDAAILKAATARKNFQTALGTPPGISNPALVALGSLDAAAADLALTLAACKPPVVTPPPVDPPPVDPPPVVVPPIVTPVGVGAPAGLAYKPWQFAMVSGAGIPPGVQPWKPGAIMEGFEFKGIESKAWYASVGIAGESGFSENITVRNAKIGPAAKWHARAHKVRGLRVQHVSDLNGPEEHDWYIEPIGGQKLTEVCFLLEDCYSLRCGSQRLQSAQRSEDGVTADLYVDGGMIVVRRDKCVDHARHASEGGTGTRQSQAYKLFSAQVGPDEAHRVNRLLLHYVLFDRIDLDDSMQKLSHGFALIGAVKGAVITGCKARGGSLKHPSTSMEAIRVESFLPTGSPAIGPLLIEGCDFNYTSGETGPGIALLDSRPVKIVNCTGNLRVQDGSGKTLGLVKDGFERNWSAAAQAIVDTIKTAGGVV